MIETNNMDTISIVQHNVLNWTNARRNELTNIYYKTKPDVILLNSTGTKNDTTLKIFNYKIYQKNFTNEDNAGIAIAVRRNIKHKIDDNFIEDFLAIQLETVRGPIAIATAYLPPRRGHMPRQDIQKLMRKTIPTYIIGDLNGRHRMFGHGAGPNEKGEFLYQNINNGNLVHYGPDFPTLLNGRGRPDIILGNRHTALNIIIKEGEITSSDHIPLNIVISSKPLIITTPKKFQLRRADWTLYKSEITAGTHHDTHQDREQTADLNNQGSEFIDERLTKWANNILKARDKAIPTTCVRLQFHPINSDLIKVLEIAYKQIKRNITLYGPSREYEAQIRYLQTEMVIENKRMHNEAWEKKINEIEIIHNDQKEFWRRISVLSGGRVPQAPYLIDEQGNKLTETNEQLQLMTRTWEKVFQISEEENEEFDEENEDQVNEFLNLNNERITPYINIDLTRLDVNNYLTTPFTTNDVVKVIKNFKDKAPGESQINREMLSHLPQESIIYYTDTLNMAFSMGYFSVTLKQGVVVLTPKEGKINTVPINYRPITLLEIHAKILEKLINERLIRHLEENEVLPKHQYGFRKNRGTQVALTTLYETLAMAQRNAFRVNVVCRDVSKAFDKVWHNGLKFKILAQNLPDVFERTLCSFLNDRQIKIKRNNIFGEQIAIKSGVPQGAILSPTLYLLYTSDLDPPEAGVLDISFADDITQVVIYPHESKEMLARKTARAITRVNEYENKWKIKTNRNKFNLISISSSVPSDVVIEGERLPFVRHTKTLGLTLARCGINTHVLNKIKQARVVRAKCRRFGGLSTKTKIHLYKTLIRPVLEYPIVPMCITSKSNIATMQRFQNICIRQAIANNPQDQGTSMEDLHDKYKIEPYNIRLHRLANRTWDRIGLVNNVLVESSNVESNIPNKQDHRWWPRVAPYVDGNQPEPIYIP